MRILWFQECKTSTVLPLLNHSESCLLNIFQFSNLLIGWGKDGPISTQYLPMQSQVLNEGEEPLLCWLHVV